jgi:hypothetical protein
MDQPNIHQQVDKQKGRKLMLSTTWMSLEDMTLSQSSKDTQCEIPLT